MPPNVKGGKGYRKGKHAPAEAKMIEWDTTQGQMLGRTLKKLGDRRFRIFCNDNKERICKLTGSMRKSDWVDEGSIVLVGVRGLGTATTERGQEVGDILSLLDTSLYGKLKKHEGVNPLLFTHVENQNDAELKKKINIQESGGDIEDDDMFEREGERPVDEAVERAEKEKARDQEISAKRLAKFSQDDDLDIDAI